MSQDVRWRQRFQNFDRALGLLRAALANRKLEAFSELELEGLAQRFEYTFELAWKTLKDYLEHSGIVLAQVTPASVIKEAFAAKIITDGDLWLEMLKRRNLLSHTYDFHQFQTAVAALQARYLPAFEQLQVLLRKESAS